MLSTSSIEEVLLKNQLPKELTVSTLKMWQRYCVALAVLETFEKTRESNVDKFGYAKDAYFRHAELIFKDQD
jgi:hypothetical protein